MPVKLLVVDDERGVRRVIQDAFEPDFDVCVAESGERALDQLEYFCPPPSAILVDYKLPGINGVELIRRIREKSKLPSIHLFTALAELPAVRQAAINAGAAYEVLAKPFHPPALKQKILDQVRIRTAMFANEVFPRETLGQTCRLATSQVLDGNKGEAFVIDLLNYPGRTITSSCFCSTEVDDDDPRSRQPDFSSCLTSGSCNNRCLFCRSWKNSYQLTEQELFEQAWIHLTQGAMCQGFWLTGIPWEFSYTGPGEPLAPKNYKAVVGSIFRLHQAFQNSSVPRKIKFTLSTAGHIRSLKSLLKEQFPEDLILRVQISVHGDEPWRKEFMPKVARTNPLAELLGLAPALAEKFGSKVWLNFALWSAPEGLRNCSPEDVLVIEKIANRAGKENVIVFVTKGNLVDGFNGVPASDGEVDYLVEALQKKHIDARRFEQVEGWFLCGKVQANLPDFSRR